MKGIPLSTIMTNENRGPLSSRFDRLSPAVARPNLLLIDIPSVFNLLPFPTRPDKSTVIFYRCSAHRKVLSLSGCGCIRLLPARFVPAVLRRRDYQAGGTIQFGRPSVLRQCPRHEHRPSPTHNGHSAMWRNSLPPARDFSRLVKYHRHLD